MLSMFTHPRVVLNAFDSLSSMQHKRRSLDDCPCCMVPYNVNEWGQMLSSSKKKLFERFMRGTDPNLSCFPDLICICIYSQIFLHEDTWSVPVWTTFLVLLWHFRSPTVSFSPASCMSISFSFPTGSETENYARVSHNNLNALSLSLLSTVIAWQMTVTAWKQAILWTDEQNMLRSDNLQCTPVAFSHCSRHKYRWHTHGYTLSEENRCQLLSTPTV